MLVISRKDGQAVEIRCACGCTRVIVHARGGVRLAVDAPAEVTVRREELPPRADAPAQGTARRAARRKELAPRAGPPAAAPPGDRALLQEQE